MNALEKIKLAGEIIRLATERKASIGNKNQIQDFIVKAEFNNKIYAIKDKLGLVVKVPRESKKKITFKDDLLVVDNGSRNGLLVKPGCDFFERMEKLKATDALRENKYDYANVQQTLIDTQAEYGLDEDGKPCVYLLPEFQEVSQTNPVNVMLKRWEKALSDKKVLTGLMFDVLADINVELKGFKEKVGEIILGLNRAILEDENRHNGNPRYDLWKDVLDDFLTAALTVRGGYNAKHPHVAFMKTHIFRDGNTAKRFIDTLNAVNPFTNQSFNYFHQSLKELINYKVPDEKDCTIYKIESKDGDRNVISFNNAYFSRDVIDKDGDLIEGVTKKGIKDMAELAASELNLSFTGADLVCFMKEGETYSHSALAEKLTPVQKAKIYTGWAVDRRVWDQLLKSDSEPCKEIRALIEQYKIIATPV